MHTHTHTHAAAIILLKAVPPFVLSNVDVLELPHSRLQHLTGIVSEIQVSDLRQWNGHYGKSLFILLGVTGADLMKGNKRKRQASLYL